MNLAPCDRRAFLRNGAPIVGGSCLVPAQVTRAADSDAIVDTVYGKVRGTSIRGVRVFKGIHYGQNTAGVNRFMPAVIPAAWTGVRDASAYGPNAPQGDGTAPPSAKALPQSEDCLVLNVFTASLTGKRPVMVWLHGGGFSYGTGSMRITEGSGLAQTGDVVVVTLNHRLNVFGATYLSEVAGESFTGSGAVGMMDIVVALEWVRDNISRFGGDSNVVTIFGQSGGGRKVTTLMSMPAAQGLFHRAIIESGAILRLPTKQDGAHFADLFLAELGLKFTQARQLQQMPVARLLAANAAIGKRLVFPEPGMSTNSPVVDGTTIPTHPWDPGAPAVSATIPLMIGWNRTEETGFDPPTPESLALTNEGLIKRAVARLGTDPTATIQAFRAVHPEATPWDLWILIGTECPRGVYTRELARRKALQGQAPAYVYRFDWDTPAGGGHMHSPHNEEIPFAFHNVDAANPLVAKMPSAHVLEAKMSSAWSSFAHTGNPNNAQLPAWPAYSAQTRDTMIFNDDVRVVSDPDRAQRLAIDKVLHLS